MTEFELIKFLTKGVPIQAAGLKVGIGDDCAVIEGESFDWLVTTDALLEGIHFDLSYTNFHLLGKKTLSVNLSDIASMGGEPLFYTMNIGLPEGLSQDRIGELYNGLAEVGGSNKVIMIGGDTCASKSGLVLSVTMIGKVGKGQAILRQGAKPGDQIYVTGSLGDAALGLRCFQKQQTGSKTRIFQERFNDPTPRLAVGKWLGQENLASSMIDISDGILSDLGHIVQGSRVGYKLESALLPLTDGFHEVASSLGLEPLELALNGGEDYELVFTVPQSNQIALGEALDRARMDLGCRLTRMGEIVADKDERIVVDKNGQDLNIKAKGFDHFGE